MIAQLTSASSLGAPPLAALVSGNKILCHPASVDSIPSSAGKEDHVSMGSISAKKLRDIVVNVRACLAIEIMTAAAGLDQRAPLKPSKGVQAALAAVRERVAPMTVNAVESSVGTSLGDGSVRRATRRRTVCPRLAGSPPRRSTHRGNDAPGRASAPAARSSK